MISVCIVRSVGQLETIQLSRIRCELEWGTQVIQIRLVLELVNSKKIESNSKLERNYKNQLDVVSNQIWFS